MDATMSLGSEPPAAAGPPKALLSLQVLRGLAALLVVFTHLSENLHYRMGQHPFPAAVASGRIGVDIFFVLSGFIMYWTSRDDFGVPGIWRPFLLRRALRIYPVYWVVTGLTLLAGLVEPRICALPEIDAGRLVCSLLLLPQETDPVVGQAWTLVHEVRFYVTFAILLRFPWRWAARLLWLWAGLSLGVLLLSHFARGWLEGSLPARGINYLCHPSSLQFILGIVAARFVCQARSSPSSEAATLGLGLLLLPLSMVAAASWPLVTKYQFLILFTVPAFLVVLGAALTERRWRPQFPRLSVLLGEASYSTYLVHLLIIIPLVWRPAESLVRSGSMWPWALGVVLVTQAISVGFHLLIEGPLHGLARAWSRTLHHTGRGSP